MARNLSPCCPSNDFASAILIDPTYNSTVVTRRSPNFSGIHPTLTESNVNPASAESTREKETSCAHGEPSANRTTDPRM